jgi:hypothetical protein
MQKESTIQFWDDYHEENGDKEWLVHGSNDLLESIYRNCGSSEDGRVRILEIGCGTSAMARDLWKYMEEAEHKKVPNGRRILVRSTDVSRVCVDACYARDKNLPNVYGPGNLAVEGHGLEYGTLDVQVTPTLEDSGQWDIVMDKACMDTFLFRSKCRGEKKEYPLIVRVALETIWMLITGTGVYILISPRPKLKAVRDFAGFSSVERREIRPETKCTIVSRPDSKRCGKRDPAEVCYMYICRKDLGYRVGDPNPFRRVLHDMPSGSTICKTCGVTFAAFRERDDPEGRGEVVWKRKWGNHCAHCKGPHSGQDPESR